ncbi:MAG: sugar ABC transporter permease [Bacteroidetes bacterium]|nr:sugar ABC transporter permease [Bacteroidota bacterium]
MARNLFTPSTAREYKQATVWVVYLLPALLFYTVFMAYPLFNSIWLSFFTGKAGRLTTFVGFDNYVRLFSDPIISERYWGAFGHTWLFFAVHMLVQNVLGMIFANFLITRKLRGAKVYQTIIFIPATLSILVTGYLWKLILNPQWGAINLVLKSLGTDNWAIPWLGDPSKALFIISLVSSWQWVGIPTMIFLAGFQNIPEDLYEAANIAGATSWQIFWKIKIPLMLPVVGVVSILTFVNNFNAFDVIFAMTNVNGAPQYATDLLGTLFYRVGIAGQHPVGIPDRGMGAAIATITFLILAVGVTIVMRFTRTGQEKE